MTTTDAASIAPASLTASNRPTKTRATSLGALPGAWPIECAGQYGGVHLEASMDADPERPPWRTAWCRQTRRERQRHGIREIDPLEVWALLGYRHGSGEDRGILF